MSGEKKELDFEGLLRLTIDYFSTEGTPEWIEGRAPAVAMLQHILDSGLGSLSAALTALLHASVLAASVPDGGDAPPKVQEDVMALNSLIDVLRSVAEARVVGVVVDEGPPPPVRKDLH